MVVSCSKGERLLSFVMYRAPRVVATHLDDRVEARAVGRVLLVPRELGLREEPRHAPARDGAQHVRLVERLVQQREVRRLDDRLLELTALEHEA